MKIAVAMQIIETQERGYMVQFEVVGGWGLCCDHFPDKQAGEDLIKTEEQAWELAKRFAAAVNPKEYVNIYVIDQTFSPVSGYDEKKLNRIR